MLAPDRRSDCKWALQNVYISLPYITAARTAGIDRIEEITSMVLGLYNNLKTFLKSQFGFSVFNFIVFLIYWN